MALVSRTSSSFHNSTSEGCSNFAQCVQGVFYPEGGPCFSDELYSGDQFNWSTFKSAVVAAFSPAINPGAVPVVVVFCAQGDGHKLVVADIKGRKWVLQSWNETDKVFAIPAELVVIPDKPRISTFCFGIYDMDKPLVCDQEAMRLCLFNPNSHALVQGDVDPAA